MNYSIVLVFLFLATTIHLTPAIAVMSAEVFVRMQMQMAQMGQASRQDQLLSDSKIVRPSLREREAISQLLATKPRPKTLNDADIKYPKDLLDKTTWFGFERRIMHEIWTEVSGKEWRDTDASQPPKTETSP